MNDYVSKAEVLDVYAELYDVFDNNSAILKEINKIYDKINELKAQEPIEARLNLCESCTKEYPECDATIDAMEFGRGVGNDNIIGCTAYVNRWKAQEPETSDVPKSDSNVGCWYDITHNYTLEQVVSALKSQGPRVLTLEEVIESEVGAVVWLEDIDKPTVIAGLVYRVFTGMMVVDFQCVARTVTAGFYDYGKRWRCWTSRPDEKTRAETPWDAQEQRDYDAAVEVAEYCEHYEPTYNAENGSM